MKVIATALKDATGHRCRLARVNGANLNGSYVGQSERNVRALFRSLRRGDGPAVLFIDELDAIGRLRGELSNVHSDRTLGTWLAELDGVDGRPKIMVIATTNRPDMIDPALRERFTREIAIPRPRRAVAAAIFARHFAEHLPYRDGESVDGNDASTRELLIEHIVGRFYDPNGGNQVATLRLRDGNTRNVSARDLMSGRIIEQTSLSARQRAFERSAEGGEPGITRGDMDVAADQALAQLRATLTLRNVDSYLADIPQDIGVVAVETVGSAQNRQRFLR
jgi:SpoVK/Ycf46/Vps4 family AAA+-type ATPase